MSALAWPLTLVAMGRSFAAGGVCVVLAVVFGGCDWTPMSASEMRQPVLLGPVACIGCAAWPNTPAASQPPSHIRAHRDTEVVVAVVMATESHTQGVPLDRVLYWTPCTDDVHLSNVRAQAWRLSIPPIYFRSDVSVEADATPIPVPGATCPPLR